MIEDFSEVIRLNPQDAGVYYYSYYNRGLAYKLVGHYERAIKDFDEATRLNPQDAKGYYVRGLAYEALGKTIEADRDFAKAKELGYDP